MSGVKNSFNNGFIACRTCIRKCWRWFLCYKPNGGVVLVVEDEFKILCIGLDGSGKTTLLNHLTGQDIDQATRPTIGFNMKTLPLGVLFPEQASLCKGKSINFKEIGGSHGVRPFWKEYFTEDTNGIMFVVNGSASESEMMRSKVILEQTLKDPELDNIPCLILSTHADCKGSRSLSQLEYFFVPVMNDRRWSVISCCCFNVEQIKAVIEVLIELIVDNQ